MRVEGRVPLGVPCELRLDQMELTGPGRGTKRFPADPDVPLDLFIDKSMASLEAPGGKFRPCLSETPSVSVPQ